MQKNEKKLALICVLLVLSALVTLALETLPNLDNYFDNNNHLKKEILSTINEQTSKVPNELILIFANKKINVYITSDEGLVKEFYAKTNNKTFDEISKGARMDADLEVRLNEATLLKIYNSKEPISELVKSISSGEIKYNGITNEGKINSTTINIVAGLLSFIDEIKNFIFGFFK
jgi:hypothetical protein